MKIYAVAFFHSECDIIESFCRYTLSYCDGILLFDNSSIDGSIDVIDNLCQEGLNILVMNSRISPKLRSLDAFNAVAEYAFTTLEADLVLPMDPDEFYTTEDGANPREFLSHLDTNTEYQVFWRTYLYKNVDSSTSNFIPKCFSVYRDSGLELFKKTIVSRHLFLSVGARISNGKHSLTYPDNYQPKIEVSKELILAHYPVRSSIQIARKVLFGQLKIFSGPPYMGFHWEQIYKQVKRTQIVDLETLFLISLEYALTDSQKPIAPEFATLHQGGLPVTFCSESLESKYTNFRKTNEVFTIALDAAEQIAGESLEKTQRLSNLQDHLKDMLQCKQDEQDNYKQHIKDLEFELQRKDEIISEYQNAFFWKLTKPLRYISETLRTLFK